MHSSCILVSPANAQKQHEQQTTVLIGAQYANVRQFVIVLPFPSMLSLPDVSALSVNNCVVVRPPRGWKTAGQPALEKSYARILKHVAVDPFANLCSPYSYHCSHILRWIYLRPTPQQNFKWQISSCTSCLIARIELHVFPSNISPPTCLRTAGTL